MRDDAGLCCYQPAGGWDIGAVVQSAKPYFLDFIECDVVGPAVIQLRCARRGMGRDARGVLDRAAIGEISRDAGRAECVVAHCGVQLRRLGAALHHLPRHRLRHRPAREHALPLQIVPGEVLEQRRCRRLAMPSPLQPFDQIVLEVVMAGNIDDLAALAVDSGGQAHVAGSTTSTNFPTTANAFQGVRAGLGTHGFLTKLDSDGSTTLL